MNTSSISVRDGIKMKNILKLRCKMNCNNEKYNANMNIIDAKSIQELPKSLHTYLQKLTSD